MSACFLRIFIDRRIMTLSLAEKYGVLPLNQSKERSGRTVCFDIGSIHADSMQDVNVFPSQPYHRTRKKRLSFSVHASILHVHKVVRWFS